MTALPVPETVMLIVLGLSPEIVGVLTVKLLELA
jgi:hypothetical protein